MNTDCCMSELYPHDVFISLFQSSHQTPKLFSLMVVGKQLLYMVHYWHHVEWTERFSIHAGYSHYSCCHRYVSAVTHYTCKPRLTFICEQKQLECVECKNKVFTQSWMPQTDSCCLDSIFCKPPLSSNQQ